MESHRDVRDKGGAVKRKIFEKDQKIKKSLGGQTKSTGGEDDAAKWFPRGGEVGGCKKVPASQQGPAKRAQKHQKKLVGEEIERGKLEHDGP